MDQDQNQIVFVNAAIWPPKGAVLESGDPNRDAVVREVRNADE